MTRASLPVIDVSPLFGGESAEKERVSKQIDNACRTWGFFYIVGHPIQQEQIDKVLKLADTFFSLPMEEKLKLDVRKGRLYRGYTAPGVEEADVGKVYTYETFTTGYHLPKHHPDVMAGKPLRGPNIHPTQVRGWMEGMEGHYRDMWALALVLLRAMAQAIGLQEDFFDSKFMDPLCELNIKHYVPLSQTKEETTLLIEHSDFGVMTLLYQDASGGLQVRDSSGELMDVPPVEGSFVVNLGDMMEMWTNGQYRSTKHRVVATGKERYSMPFFCNPNPNVIVKCLDNCHSEENPPRYPPVRAVDWILKRFAEAYGKDYSKM
ncbi:iron/ascorbate oxidoreductase family protein, putative [Trypanosoma brucei brucei TREU927]|uniref:Iron/ascorbate oxidoreductase family protein, putative n=1 Tax=Trypanosoma brucei brucei (strain 927/4 GUTat10.1) TaxID=185431 RepID=Q586M6_TRYB2|nr:iron/ascorbate oxidoreductase family protein, putative [Trypanosoma brucei brucei TREU927]AAQ16088.1 iron/ascorbate oxidoreductase family protein, putative [Trypanosoma brucei brucei TREU927]AAX80335.1 iron/ascorbate oxidoreductase family protein, putative [Trypanosoma brucei]